MKDEPDEKPPIAGSWRALYGLLAGTLVLLILLFYLFTKHFA